MHKQKKNGLLTQAAFNKELCIHKQKLDELQKRQKVLYEQQGNTLAVEYWLNQFQDATDRKDEAAAEPTVVKTLVEKMIVNNETMTVDIHFKCGVVIREVL